MTAAEENPVVKPKRGPKSRADIEAEIRAQIMGEERERIAAEIRAELEAEEAKAQAVREAEGRAAPITGDQIDGDPKQEGAVTVHFVEDGFTILGKVWYAGEPLTLNPGTQNWEDSKVTFNGEQKVFAILDEDEQIAKWGKRIFRPGPGKGGYNLLLDNPELTDEERRSLERAAALHEERYGALVTR